MRVRHAVALALALCVASCSGKKEGTEAKPPAEGAKNATVSAPPTRNTKPSDVGAFRMGRALAPDGTATDEGSPFGQGEPIQVTFQVNNLNAGANVRIVVTSLADNRKVDEQQKAPGAKNEVAFALPPTKTWPQGDYRIDMQLVEGSTTRSMGVYDFKIGPPRPERK
jgi:hypothetical protein